MKRARSWLTILAVVGCGGGAPDPAPTSPAPSATEPMRPTSTARVTCAQVDLGLDLRVLPSPPEPVDIERYVSAQGARLAEHAVPGDAPRIEAARDHGVVRAWFDGDEALSRCQRTVDAYLEHAPRLPVLMSPAVHVDSPCRPCEQGTADAEHATAPVLDPALPAPIPVCVRRDGALHAGVAIPSRAGVYDPSHPIVPEHLNWTVAGAGCVVYPAPDLARETCDAAQGPAAVVEPTLCAQ